MINKPPPFNRDYNRDPNIKALKGRGFINHGSTLWQAAFMVVAFRVCGTQPDYVRFSRERTSICNYARAAKLFPRVQVYPGEERC